MPRFLLLLLAVHLVIFSRRFHCLCNDTQHPLCALTLFVLAGSLDGLGNQRVPDPFYLLNVEPCFAPAVAKCYLQERLFDNISHASHIKYHVYNILSYLYFAFI